MWEQHVRQNAAEKSVFVDKRHKAVTLWGCAGDEQHLKAAEEGRL